MKIDLKMILIAGAVYWLFFKGNTSMPLVRSGGVPMGEGYP